MTSAAAAAEAYQRHLVPAVYGPWAADVIRIAAPAEGERALDVACGTGAATLLLAARVGPRGSVAGIDLNPAMLAVARRLAAERGIAIDFREAPADVLPFTDALFDLVTCVQALQSFADLGRALGEMRRVLRVGGRLVASVWRHIDHCPGYLALSQAIARHVGPEAATFGPGRLGDTELLRAVIAAAGFADISIQVADRVVRFPSAATYVEWMGAGAPRTGRALSQVPSHARQAFMDQIDAALAPYEAQGELVLPMACHVVTARRLR